MNPFETLGIAPRYALDLKDLATRQRELSKKLHPDRFVGRPASERRAALGRAIEVNEAHRILKNPLTRAEALLDHLGLSLSEEQQAPASPELLMETMERREALRDAGRAKDGDKVAALAEEVKAEESKLLGELEDAFSEALENSDAPRPEAQALIFRKLGNLRYLRRFIEEADAIMDELI